MKIIAEHCYCTYHISLQCLLYVNRRRCYGSGIRLRSPSSGFLRLRQCPSYTLPKPFGVPVSGLLPPTGCSGKYCPLHGFPVAKIQRWMFKADMGFSQNPSSGLCKSWPFWLIYLVFFFRPVFYTATRHTTVIAPKSNSFKVTNDRRLYTLSLQLEIVLSLTYIETNIR